jgi:hypothetical protein
VYTDASYTCIGAVLCKECEPDQRLLPYVPNSKPIHHLSHRLSSTKQRLSTLEKEAFAIKYALEKIHPYIHNAPTACTVRTDHAPLKYLLQSPMQNRKVQMWALAISGYDVKVY